MSLQAQDLFAADFAGARAVFLQACRDVGVQVRSHEHPLRAPDGSPLATDVARVGADSASRLLILTSGPHGPELMAGSACQAAWLHASKGAALPADTAVLLIHAINPWGAAHLRRNTEDNVDLCRNWIDFDLPLPQNPAYAGLHAAVNVAPHDAAAVAAGDARLEAYRAANGTPGLYGALMAGQYALAQGLGFGGFGPTWSRQVMESILKDHAGAARRVCMVDYHTGVGPYAYGSAVALQVGESLARARRAFGEWVIAPNAADRPADFVPVSGHTTPGYEHALAHAQVTSVVLEFGTYSSARMLDVLLDDHRLTFGACVEPQRLNEARQAVRAFFYPSDPHWRDAVLGRSAQIIRQGFEFLASEDRAEQHGAKVAAP